MKRLWQRHRNWFLAVLPGLAAAAFLAWWFTPRPMFMVALPQPEVTDYEIEQLEHKTAYLQPNPPEHITRWVAIRYIRDLASGWYFLDQRTLRLARAWHVPEPKWAHLMNWRFDREGRFVVVYHANERGYEDVEAVYWFNPDTLESGSAHGAKATRLATLTPPTDSLELLDLPDSRAFLTGEPYATQVSTDGRHVMWRRRMTNGTQQNRVTRTDKSAATGWFTLPDELKDGIFVPGTAGIVTVSAPNTEPTKMQRFIQALIDKVDAPIRITPPQGDQAFWYDWKNQQVTSFRSTEPETIDGLATQKERITLLINAYGPSARIEVWNAPPPRRPTFVIWITSLLASLGTWLWIRRRSTQSVTP
ncbi:MAG: hypothetical protein AB8G99_03360 [Planctomycetaceae bacterium]